MNTQPIPPQHPLPRHRLPRHRRNVETDALNTARCRRGVRFIDMRCIDMRCPHHAPGAYAISARHKARGW